MLNIGRYLGGARYAAALVAGLLFLGGTGMFAVNQAQSGIKARPVETAPTLLRPSYLMPVPEYKAAALDASRTVRADVKGKSDPVTRPAPVQTADLSAPLPSTAGAGGGTTVSINNAANVRSAPSTASRKLFVAQAGDSVEVLGTERGWTHIQTADGLSGWIATRFLNQ